MRLGRFLSEVAGVEPVVGALLGDELVVAPPRDDAALVHDHDAVGDVVEAVNEVGKGKLKISIIPKFQEKPGNFDDLLLIGFDKTHLEDQNHMDRMVHFFLYDYRFERVWKNPDNDIEKLSRYRTVLSPDFSMYLEMAPVMQLYNVFRNRWCGALGRKKSFATIHRFPKCRATLSMWITNAVPGGT